MARGVSVNGRVSVSILEQIRQASDIVDVVSSTATLKRAGRTFKGLCPFHREKTPSFTVNPEKQVFYCFGCGAGGDVFKFVQLRENVDFREAIAILAVRAGITIEEPKGGPTGAAGTKLSKVDLERANRWACRWFQQQLRSSVGESARRYAVSRGFTDASIERFGVGYAPEGWETLTIAARAAGVPAALLVATGLVRSREDGSVYDAFRNRLMFPIRDAMDRIVGFGGRTLGDDPAKYVNSPQSVLFDKSRTLYGIATAKNAFATTRAAVVVEGYVDCLMAQQHGFDHVVATLGTALTPEHVQLLRRYVDRVILVFDSDAAGQKAADNALRLFVAERLDVALACVPEAKDPADLLVAAGAATFERVLTSAVGALEFKWNQIRRRFHDAATGPDRRRAVEEFLGLVASSGDLEACDPIQRGLILNQVGKLLGLPGEEVHRQLRIISRRTPLPPRNEAVAREPAAAPTDAAGRAMRDVLEVVLNEPAHYQAAEEEFDPALLADAELRCIAEAVAELAKREEGFVLSDVISRFDSARIAGRIMELQAAGERLGNFEAVVQGALHRLRELREQTEQGSLLSRLRGTQASQGDDAAGSPQDQGVSAVEEERSLLRAASQKRGGIGSFAGHRHSAAALSLSTKDGTKQTEPAG
jgi:DNA primase